MSNSATSLLAAPVQAAKHWRSWEVLRTGHPCVHGPCHVAGRHLNFRAHTTHICQAAIAGCSRQSDKVTHQNSTQEFLQQDRGFTWSSQPEVSPGSEEESSVSRGSGRTIAGPGRATGYLRNERKTCNRKDEEAATGTARGQEKV